MSFKNNWIKVTYRNSPYRKFDYFQQYPMLSGLKLRYDIAATIIKYYGPHIEYVDGKVKYNENWFIDSKKNRIYIKEHVLTIMNLVS